MIVNTRHQMLLPFDDPVGMRAELLGPFRQRLVVFDRHQGIMLLFGEASLALNPHYSVRLCTAH